MIIRIPLHLLLSIAIILPVVLYPDVSNAQSDPTARQGTLTLLGHGAGSPDDVAVGADDTIYFSDMHANQVLRLRADGTAEAVSPTIREPEGVVPQPDGKFVAAAQASNRLYRVSPIRKTMTQLYDVDTRAANATSDGAALD